MNYDALWILVIPAVGLFPILRGGRWRWRVAESSALLTWLFWFGWTASLAIGLLSLFRLA